MQWPKPILPLFWRKHWIHQCQASADSFQKASAWFWFPFGAPNPRSIWLSAFPPTLDRLKGGCVARAPRLPRCLAPGGPHGRGLGRRQRRPAIRVPLEGALEVSKGCKRIQKSPTKYNGFWISLYKSFAEPSNEPVVLDEELACTKLAIAFADSEAWIAALALCINWFMIASNCCWLGPCIGGTWYAPSVASIFTNRQCRRYEHLDVKLWRPEMQKAAMARNNDRKRHKRDGSGERKVRRVKPEWGLGPAPA